MRKATSFSSFTTGTFVAFNIVYFLYSYGIFWKQSDPHKYWWKRICVIQARSAPPHPSLCNTTQHPQILSIFLVLVYNYIYALQTEICVRNEILVRPWPEWPERFHRPCILNHILNINTYRTHTAHTDTIHSICKYLLLLTSVGIATIKNKSATA